MKLSKVNICPRTLGPLAPGARQGRPTVRLEPRSLLATRDNKTATNSVARGENPF